MKCPCCSNKLYSDCCGPYLSGEDRPCTPLALMRSRYTAYSQSNIDYIEKTMRTTSVFDRRAAKAWADSARWEKLEIIDSDCQDEEGFVEFKAYYKEGDQAHCLHERSRFLKEHDQWLYIDGEHQNLSPVAPPKRNDPCFCGSGKKYKKCCL